MVSLPAGKSILADRTCPLDMPTSDQCAVGPDGKLLDQRAIIWYNDPEDSSPIAPVTSPAIPSASSASSVKATTLRTFFKDGTTPSLVSAVDTGTRRSSRVSKPSKRILDMGQDSDVPKRARVARKRVVESEIDDEEDDEEGDDHADDNAVTTHASDAGGGDTDVEMGDPVTVEDAYASTKVMGDQDRKVCALTSLFALLAQF
jgi:hypothetical protein